MISDLQKAAEEWIDADNKLVKAQKDLAHAEREVDIIRRIKEAAAGRLADRVGRNVPTKVFTVGAEAVVVEHERGLRRVPIEDKEK